MMKFKLVLLLAATAAVVGSAAVASSSENYYSPTNANNRRMIRAIRSYESETTTDFTTEDVLPSSTNLTETTNNSAANGATCYDRKLSSIIDSGLNYYAHDMSKLASYILSQMQKSSYPGYWLVQAINIYAAPQGPDWQATTNGDLFQAQSRYGCYYHDTRTFISIVRYH